MHHCTTNQRLKTPPALHDNKNNQNRGRGADRLNNDLLRVIDAPNAFGFGTFPQHLPAGLLPACIKSRLWFTNLVFSVPFFFFGEMPNDTRPWA